jgi:hypothetical protein
MACSTPHFSSKGGAVAASAAGGMIPPAKGLHGFSYIGDFAGWRPGRRRARSADPSSISKTSPSAI